MLLILISVFKPSVWISISYKKALEQATIIKYLVDLILKLDLIFFLISPDNNFRTFSVYKRQLAAAH
jgi:hypothetical protein